MAGSPQGQSIPEATVSRLPLYLRSLQELMDEQLATVSSERLAEMAGVNAAKVRKDLSYFGSYGTRGVGYDVEYLLLHIRRELGLTHDWPCVIAGMGNLGQALANYGGFSERGFVIAALVDANPAKVGTELEGVRISHVDELGELVSGLGITIGVIATPAHAAQEVANSMVEAGITSILNFAPTVITVPDGILVRKVDLAVELQIPSFYQERRSGGSPTTPGLASAGS